MNSVYQFNKYWLDHYLDVAGITSTLVEAGVYLRMRLIKNIFLSLIYNLKHSVNETCLFIFAMKHI